jgi:hypothetical protein
VLARANRLLDADMQVRHREFPASVNQASKEFAGSNTGSNHIEHVRKLCAAELHVRVRLALDKLWAARGAMSAPLSESYSDASKDWIAAQAHAAAKDLQQYAVRPASGYGGIDQSDAAPNFLLAEQDAEISAANAEIDNHFDVSWLQRVNQWIRWAFLAGRFAISALVKWLFSGSP